MTQNAPVQREIDDPSHLYEVDLGDSGDVRGLKELNPHSLMYSQESIDELRERWAQDNRDPDFPGTRRAIPVSTLHWRSTDLPQLVPQSGLEFLSGVEHLEIQQTVELNDLLAMVESENRYNVRVPNGETLFVAAETSSSTQRLCMGSNRGFYMRLLDPTQQEVLHLNRRLACKTGLLGCYLQRLVVLTPPGKYLGSVHQTWTLTVPVLHVEDDRGRVVYRVEGPSMCVPKDAVFKITCGDGLTELGSISHEWTATARIATYSIHITFPSAATTNAHKALLLSAAFLLEYMYFETSKKKSWLPCC